MEGSGSNDANIQKIVIARSINGGGRFEETHGWEIYAGTCIIAEPLDV